MIKTNILRAKIKRSNVNFKDTHIYDSESMSSNSYLSSKFFLQDEEDPILCYIGSNKYKWILTNQRLIFPNSLMQIDLLEIKDISFDNIIDNPEQKMTNTELTLHTKDEKINLILEEGSWPLIYEVFKFIVNNNK